MAATKTKPRGPKGDKICRDALMMELAEEISVTDPANPKKKIKIKKLRLLMRAWVNAGIKGDSHACDKIVDRIDGKVPSTIRGPGKNGAFPVDYSKVPDADLVVLERVARTILGFAGDPGREA